MSDTLPDSVDFNPGIIPHVTLTEFIADPDLYTNIFIDEGYKLTLPKTGINGHVILYAEVKNDPKLLLWIKKLHFSHGNEIKSIELNVPIEIIGINNALIRNEIRLTIMSLLLFSRDMLS